MKKIIPVLIAVVLIIIIVGVSFGKEFKEKYSYSQDQADLNEYFGVSGDEGAIIMQDEVILDKARVGSDGTFYITYDTVSDYFIYTRLYVNETENTKGIRCILRLILSGCLRCLTLKRSQTRIVSRSILLMAKDSLRQ